MTQAEGVSGQPPVALLKWRAQPALATPETNFGLLFGSNVAASGETVFVSGELDVWSFLRVGDVWTAAAAPKSTLSPCTGLAAQGSTVAIGTGWEDFEDRPDAGSAYVTRTDQGAAPLFWKPQGETAGDLFGFALAVGTELLVVGAPGNDRLGEDAGAVYVYRWNGSAWGAPEVLYPPESPSGAGGWFGAAVAVGVSDDTILVGAPYDSALAESSGAAYLFAREGDEWIGSRLVREDPQPREFFGVATALAGATAAVGAYGRGENGPDSGAVYVFAGTNGTWSQQQRLLPKDGAEGDQFGYSLSLGLDVLLVGAPYRDPSGAAYIFTREASVWSDAPSPILGAAGEELGRSVAMLGARAVIGAPKSANTVGQGSAYVLGLTEGVPCSSASECASGYCVQDVCCDQICDGDCEACVAAQKENGADGSCGPISEGAEPRAHGCEAAAPEYCGQTGLCDGGGECARYPEGTVCGGSTCFDVSSKEAKACDGRGACLSIATSCLDYRCEAGECLEHCSSHADCSERAFCLDGTCLPKLTLAAMCAEADECESGFCADGVCCAAKCDGRCEACAESKFVGACVPVRGAPRGDRPVCPEGSAEEPCLAAQCDGENTAVCLEHPGEMTACSIAGCDGPSPLQEGTCDGAGSCQCPTGQRCNAEGTAVREEGKDDVECTPFSCRLRSCLQACQSDVDCAPGFDCNPTNQRCEVVQERKGAARSSSCALRLSARGTKMSPGVLLMLGAWAIRRKRLGRLV